MAEDGWAQRVSAHFQREFGAVPRVFFAPGRVNLSGAHLDYNGGDVLPMAVDRGIWVAAGKTTPQSGPPMIRCRSLNKPRVVDVSVTEIGDAACADHGWASYPLGVLKVLFQTLGLRLEDSTCGFDLVVGGDLPMASGMSSSAALEVATASAVAALRPFTPMPSAAEMVELEPVDFARIGHAAENGYVGMKCGIMDQYASALGQGGHVLLLRCRGEDGPTWEHVPLDPNAVAVLVMDTKKPRELAGSAFNDRVAECAEAHRILRETVRDLPVLALYTMADLEAAGDALRGIPLRRARHVVTEMQRIAGGVAALRKGDVAGLGAALNGSHQSTSTDYDVSCPELDTIAGASREVAGTYGARLTGAGFGGCAIALVAPEAVDQVIAHVHGKFEAEFGVEPGFDVLRPGDGPREVTP